MGELLAVVFGAAEADVDEFQPMRPTRTMTFIVNQDGIVYQKNLGPDTVHIAAAITSFDPDRDWQPSHTDR